MGLYISYARGKNVVLTSLDAAVRGTLERTAALNGMVQGRSELLASLNANVVLFTTYEKTAALNAAVATRYEKTASLNSNVILASTTYEKTAAMNALVYSPAAMAQKFYLKMDGNVLDATGNGWNGTPAGLTYSMGRVNTGGVFASPSSYVTIASPTLGTAFSLAMWIYPTANATQGLMVEASNTHGWYRRSTGTINWYDPAGAPWYPSTLTAPLNAWTHIVLTHDGTTVRHYINGVLDASTYSRPSVNFTPVQIGADTSSNGFTGTIDEVGAWTRVLSADEISTIYNAGVGNPYSYIHVNTGAWVTTGAMVTRRNSAPAVLLNTGKVLVAGGNNSTGSLAVSELFNPATGTWASTGALVAARDSGRATLLPSGKVLYSGGYNAGYKTTCELYDPTATTWATTGAMSTARAAHAAILLNTGKVLVVGGENPITAVCELYDPAAGTWATTGPMSTVRQYPQVALLANGRVLACGGYNGSSWLTSAEIYDPAAGTWSGTGSLAAGGRAAGTAVTLLSGKVLIAGGSRNAGPTLVLASELYDPVAGTFSVVGYLTAGRDFCTGILLPSGNVLIPGGRAGGSGSMSSAEVYDPVANRWNTANPMSTTRDYSSVALLPSGKTLVAGAYTGTDGVNTAELYLESYDSEVTGHHGLGTWDDPVALYQGTGWNHLTGQLYVYGGTLSRTLNAGDRCIFGFNSAGGSGAVTFISKIQPDSAAVDIYMDGVFLLRHQQWGGTSGTYVDQYMLSLGTFTPGPHILEIVHTGVANPYSMSAWGSVDGFIIS